MNLRSFPRRASVGVATFVSALLAIPGAGAGPAGSVPPEKVVFELLQLEEQWAQALIKNDAEAVGQFTVEDWIIVDPDGRVIDKAKILATIKSGALSHDTMRLEEPRVRVYGTTAVVTGLATSGGTYMGTAFTTHERSTDVFVKQGGRWRCVLTQLTQLTRLAARESPPGQAS